MGRHQSGRWRPAGNCALCRWRTALMGGLRKAAWYLLASASVTISALTLQAQPEDGAPTFTVSDLPVGRPLRILVYGDMRFTDPSNTSDTSPGVRKWLAEKVGEEKPDVMLL